MSTCLLVIDDGRGHLDGCLESAVEHLPPMEACVMVDDSDHELGFAGAIQAGWEAALQTGCQFVFHLESDFRFNGPVPIERMKAIVRAFPKVAQVALKRQPVNERECAAGGIVEADPDDFEEWAYSYDEAAGEVVWATRHRRFFTTNPSLYRASLCREGWPQESESEGKFSLRLFYCTDAVCTFLGRKFDPPMVEHVGAVRVGHGY